MDIKVTLNTEKKAKPQDESKLGFGKIFTDHMFIMEYEAGKGWMNPRIEPYHALALDPASTVLHYGQEIFEGLKAYRAEDDRILMFRAKDNCRRLNRSADRMCMPEIDVDFNFKAMQMLVDVERDWVPHSEGTSLYLRPTMIANDVGHIHVYTMNKPEIAAGIQSSLSALWGCDKSPVSLRNRPGKNECGQKRDLPLSGVSGPSPG